MTIGEAVDSNKELKGELLEEKRLQKAKAVQLGIEALKREQLNRRYGRGYPCNRLPGETED